MKLSICFFLFLLAISGMAQAGVSCRIVHKDGHPNFQRSLEFRANIQTMFEIELKMMEKDREEYSKSFMNQISERAVRFEVAKWIAVNTPRIGGPDGPKLDFSKNHKPPMIAAETMKALEDAYGRQEKPISRQERQLLQEEARKIVSQDPYFVWLKENKVDNRVVKTKDGTFNVTEKGLEPDQNSTDPVELLFSTLDASGPTVLSPQQSVIRVYRDLDPDLSIEQTALAHYILESSKKEMGLRYAIENLRSDGGGAGPRNAGGLAPSIAEAKQNIANIFNQQIKLYGNQFPQKSYQILFDLVRAADPVVYPIGEKMSKFEIANLSDPSKPVRKEISLLLTDLKRKLELPNHFPNEKLINIRRELVKSVHEDFIQYKYQNFLIRMFENQATDAAIRQIMQLNDLIQLAEAATNELAMYSYQLRSARQLKFWY